VRLRFLGTGTSFGIPQVGCGCAVCHSTDPRDTRTRSAAVVESGDSRLLVDTPPELRIQLIREGIDRVDAVLYTHEHADHITGIDDLRAFSERAGRALPVYGSPETLDRLGAAFAYIFDDAVAPVRGTSKPRLRAGPLEPGVPVAIGGVEVLPLEVWHGPMRVFGYRFGGLAYITDAKRIPASTLALLRGVDVLVLNALWWRPHPTHLSIDEAIELARAIGARRTLLTHLTHETGHAELAAALPAGIEPAHDGLAVEVS
jgi:phosphoribosyl 1,2-cyclic phosphate phosphodiesterase